jgi:hypothetical protein
MRVLRLGLYAAAAACLLATGAHAAQPLECANWQSAHPEWLWCDDFESDSSLEQNYFDVERADGRLKVATDAAFGGGASLKGTYIPSDPHAGSIKLSLGATPVAPKRYTDQKFDEVYWRFYMRTSTNWTGNAYKVTRATVFSASNWSQAAIGHLWDDSPSKLGMALDPVSGVVGSTVVTTKYNDFDNMKWLGKVDGPTQVYAPENRGVWTCVEVHMKLNTPGASDGLLEYWVNDKSEAQAKNLNFRGSYTQYGINAVLMENYRNEPAAQSQDRYFDNFVVSKQRIGCVGSSPVRPNPPTNVKAN